jgi:rare lipoprotein A
VRHKGIGGGWSRTPTLGVALLLLTAGFGRVDAQTAAPLGGSFDQWFINQDRVAPVFTRPEVRTLLPPLPLPEESTPASTQTTAEGASGGSDVAEPQSPVFTRPAVLSLLPPLPLPEEHTPPAEQTIVEAAPRGVDVAEPQGPVTALSKRLAPPVEASPPPVMTGSLPACLPAGQTVSDERFNPNRITAAHRTLPFGVNLRQRRPVTVRLNDRGPPKLKLASDVSRACARALGITEGNAVALYRVHGALGASAHQPIRPKRPFVSASVMKRDHLVETTGSIPVRPRPRFVPTPAGRFALPATLRPTGL